MNYFIVRNLTTVLVCFLFLVCCPYLYAHTDTETLELRSASEFDYPPFSIVNERGEADGFSVELLKSALREVGYTVSFTTGPWKEIKKKAVAKEIDVLPLVVRTHEREAFFDFTFPYLKLHGAIVTRVDGPQIESLKDLHKKEVAVVAESDAEEFIRRQDLDINITRTSTFKDALVNLSAGDYDAVVMQNLVAGHLIDDLKAQNLRIVDASMKNFWQDFCFAVPEGEEELLNSLNEGLAIVMSNGTFSRLREKWFGNRTEFHEKHILVGGDFNYPPYEYLDRYGQPAGYNVDLTEAIARHLHISVEYQLGPWNAVINDLENETIDIVQGMFVSPERAKKFVFSSPHTTVNYVAVVRHGQNFPESLDDLDGKTVIVQGGDILHDKVLKSGISSNLIIADSQEEALRLLSIGKGDCALVTRLSALYWIRNHDWQNLEVGNAPFASFPYAYSAHPDNTQLIKQFSQTLEDLEASGELRKIKQKYPGIFAETAPDFAKVGQYLLVAIVALMLLLIVAVVWTRALKRQVSVRSKALALEIAEKQQIDEELTLTQNTLQAAMDQSPAGIIIAEAPDGKLRYINEAGLNLMGISKDVILKGINAEQCSDYWQYVNMDGQPFSSEELPAMMAINTGEVCNREYIVRQKSGEERTVLSSAAPIKNKSGAVEAAIVVYNDMTYRIESEKKYNEMQKEMHQLQKIESVGRLAGGVAHDYNNMLSVIIGYTEMALWKIDESHEFHKNFSRIHSAAMRSKDITQQLLAFARKQFLAPKVIDLNATVENMLKMLQHLIGENIDLEWQPRENVWPVMMDPTQLDQILANLCINARDAIEDVGKIHIKTNRMYIDQAYCDTHPGFRPGHFVTLAVSDDGHGMDKQTLEKVFEPFFTTKEEGKGTGLGLSMVYGAIKQSNGYINVFSEPGMGTTFKLYFPKYEGDVAEQEEIEQTEAFNGGNETILVVEDETIVMNMIETILEDIGYEILSAATPREALSIAEKYEGEINLLITDVIMPEMNGMQLSEQIKAKYPEIQCLFMSGYMNNIITDSEDSQEDINFIQKPFSPIDFSQQIRTILG